MFNEYFSTWNLIRLSGFLSYFLLTASLAFGFLQAFPSLKRRKGEFLQIHQTSGWIGLLGILYHMMMLYWDQYVHYPIFSILVPFSSEHEAFYSGLGTISFYLFFLIIGSSDFLMKKLGRSVWKKIHLLAVPAWLLMTVHGILLGTDSSEKWAQFIYFGSISIIIVLGILKGAEIVNSNSIKNATKKTS
ncbi:ferric reductase-like transmembrane domain-containing protein [Neobacillus sp. LXY-4]|uniref:ferric reductase-like transmembrane domain-containing protein n=1 Tax=Neobacillus sp. LXY-4 TaxID=3379826 RepID=UPI003EDF9B3D